MIIYHTIRLTDISEKQTIIFDVETRETNSRKENIYTVLDDYNKEGYYLTSVDRNHFYLTKRVD